MVSGSWWLTEHFILFTFMFIIPSNYNKQICFSWCQNSHLTLQMMAACIDADLKSEVNTSLQIIHKETK